MRQRILIVDDDLRHSQLLATYFDGQGFDSLFAEDVIEMQQKPVASKQYNGIEGIGYANFSWSP